LLSILRGDPDRGQCNSDLLLNPTRVASMMLLMHPAVPLHELIGARLRELREGAGLTQEEIAAQARVVGFADWARGTVSMIEGGRRRVTLEEFLALPLILSYAGAGQWRLVDLLGAETPAIISAEVALAAETLRAALSGRLTVEVPPMSAARTAPARDPEERREALSLWRRWASRRSDRSREPSPATLAEVAVESRSDAVVSAARHLRCSPVAASLAAVVTYRRLLRAEREERVGHRLGEGERNPRTLQAIRGHVTRELLRELRPVVRAMTSTTTRETRR
jgi:transcriptional regulator with XRE-family HTH domain